MIIAVLNFTLIPQFSGSQVGLTEMENVESDINLDETSNTNMDVQAIYFGLYSIAIVQALGDGLVCGQLLYQKPTLGFKHSFIMLISTFVCFKFLMPL